jgi:hypothetical protein
MDQPTVQNAGPPYLPNAAALGGVPSVSLDVPVAAVFLFLFLIGAISHMTILQINQRRGHKFILSGLLFGFCMARITTCVLRIAWATHLDNVSLAIAAQVFVAAGVILLFIINNIFAQRIMRASHRNSGWHPFFHYFFVAVYTLIVLSLIVVITATVLLFYTLDPGKRATYRDLQLYAGALFAVVAFLPIPLVILSLAIPRTTAVDKFGSGRFRTKIAILLFSAFLLSLGACFRIGTNSMMPRPRANPAWYQSKACFYIFNFTVEIIVVLLYIVVRVDMRFHIPNGSKGPGSYSGTQHGDKAGHEGAFADRIMSEEEDFDNEPSRSTENGS